MQVCEYLRAIGVTAVLLRYRTPTADEEQPQAYPLQDLQRAMGIVRHRTQLPPPLLLPNQVKCKEPHQALRAVLSVCRCCRMGHRSVPARGVGVLRWR